MISAVRHIKSTCLILTVIPYPCIIISHQFTLPICWLNYPRYGTFALSSRPLHKVLFAVHNKENEGHHELYTMQVFRGFQRGGGFEYTGHKAEVTKTSPKNFTKSILVVSRVHFF